jgi:glycerol-3-phosphate dehydrogenase
VDGNITVGPSAEYIDERDDYAVTRAVLDSLIRDGMRIFPYLKREHFIRNFAGIRPKLTDKSQGGYHDFVIESRPENPRVIHLIGIESPGLTSCLPIARDPSASGTSPTGNAPPWWRRTPITGRLSAAAR